MKNYERELPSNYHLIYTIDAKNKKTAFWLNVLCLAVLVLAFAVLFLIYGIKFQDAKQAMAQTYFLLAVLLLIPLIVVHELLHGIAYYILTRQKLKFGLTGTFAFCGVPQIYVYKKAALISLLTPFVVLGTIFATGMILAPSEYKVIWIYALSMHIGSCVGDLFDTFMLIFRFRGHVLMNDTGPAQTFYSDYTGKK